MTDVFISYSRKDSDFVRRLTNALSRSGRDVWVDWQDIPRGVNWLNEIFTGIEHADTFLIIVSRYSLTSEICNDEIHYAREKNKRIFPLIREEIKDEVFNEVVGSWYGKPWEQEARENWTEISHVNWVFFNDDNRFDPEFDALAATLEIDQAHVHRHTRYLVRALEWERGGRKPSLLLISDEITVAEIWLKDAEGKVPLPTRLHHEYIQESRHVEDERQRQAEAQERRVRQFRRATAALAVMVALAAVSVFAAIIQSGQVRAERQLFGIQVGRVVTLAAGGVVVSLDDIAPTPEAFMATASAIAELVVWKPVIQEFGDAEMVQVPPGCFWMGSILSVYEQPTREICFSEPLWIDKFEVTNAQFRHITGQSPPSRQTGEDHPVDSITWFEARDFCELRGTRLPTEAEWEYTARGPNSLVYPWGNEFVSDNVVYYDNSPDTSADVGSRPGGASWVGAYDMAGNVMEWVSTIYDNEKVENEFPYPYNPKDGRENPDRADVSRVLRGGSFGVTYLGLRAALRNWGNPHFEDYDVGFRCARSQ
jgi:formylglycine-generating enzyme required for sulfatase activity